MIMFLEIMLVKWWKKGLDEREGTEDKQVVVVKYGSLEGG